MTRSYVKNCDTCGRRLSIRFMAGSNESWLPFDYDTGDKHDCYESQRFMPVLSRGEHNAELSSTHRRLAASSYKPSGPVQAFVDGIGSSIQDMQPGRFQDTLVAREGFTLRCDDSQHGFAIDGGDEPALIVDAGNAVVAFRGVEFVSTSALGAIVVISGGLRLEGCSIIGESIGIDIAASMRSSRIADTRFELSGHQATGIRMGPRAKLTLANVDMSGASKCQLDVDPSAKVDGFVNRPTSTSYRSPTLAPEPVPILPSAHLLLASSLAELVKDFAAAAEALLDSINAAPPSVATGEDIDEAEGHLEFASLQLYDLYERIEICEEHVAQARELQ